MIKVKMVIYRKIFFILFLFTILLTNCSVLKYTGISSSNIIIVPDQFPTIQNAIDNASAGDTIFIKAGKYAGNIKITKPVHIVGESPNDVIIIPSLNENAYGIKCEFNDNILFNGSIKNLQLRGFVWGIDITYMDVNEISNCIIIGDGLSSAIIIHGAKTKIKNCTIVGNIRFSIKTSECSITKCIIYSEFNNIVNDEAITIGSQEDIETISPSSIKDNIIFGTINFRADSTNKFIDPEFKSIKDKEFASIYTPLGYGAEIEVGENKNTESIPTDIIPPEISIIEPLFVSDTVRVESNYLYLRLSIVDESPISELKINNVLIEKSQSFTKEQLYYKWDFKTSVLLGSPIQTLLFTAKDLYGNISEISKVAIITNENIYKGTSLNVNLSSNNIKLKKFKKLAWVIGVDEYPKELPQLKYTISDARAMKDLLEEHDYKVIYKENPNVVELRKSLKALEDLTEYGDRVLLYYSGHGSAKSISFRKSTGLLLPADIDTKDLENTAFPMEDLRVFVSKLNTPSVIMILDACFASGGKSYGPYPKLDEANEITNQLLVGEGKILLASSGDLEKSFEDNKLKHGVFTYFLIDAIKRENRSIDNIYEYVYKKVYEFNGQRPRKETITETIGLQPLL